MEKLLEYLNAERGRRQALAAALECSPSAISMWKQVPAERIGVVSRATGIPPHDLRPDIFGPAPVQATGAAA
jgi:DNA-binding transcriptional regulator YdaS (Cro superfamily)